MTPAALVELYSGMIVTDSLDHHVVVNDLRAMTAADLHRVERLAPALSRLRRLAAVEIDRRAHARECRRVAAVMAGDPVPRVRVDSVEEL